MAKIGHRTCQPIMDCGTGKWGNIKTSAATIFVHQSYTGRDSDGSQAKPYTSIAVALKKASSDGHIAVAAGTYHEDLNINTPVTIEGVCPQKVTVKNLSNEKWGTVDIMASGTTRVRSISITGTLMGVVVYNGATVEIADAAVVGCDDEGVRVEKSSVTITGSLVSGNRSSGIYLWGSKGTFKGSVFRGTRFRLYDKKGGEGIYVDSGGKEQSVLDVSECVVDGNVTTGIDLWGSSATVQNTLIRNTAIRPFDRSLGTGISASFHPDSSRRSTFTISESVVANNHYTGILLQSSTGTIKRTVVRSTESDATGYTGRGIDALLYTGQKDPSRLTLTDSLVIGNRDTSIHLGSSSATIERTVVTGTRPTEKPKVEKGSFPSRQGIGINVVAAKGSKSGASLVLSDSLVSGNHLAGVLFSGSKGTISRSIITDTKPDTESKKGGEGINVEADHAIGIQSTVTVTGSLVQGNHAYGIRALSSALTVERSIVKDTRAEVASKLYGFGIAAVDQLNFGKPSTLAVSDSIVSGSTTAGVAIANSTAVLQRSTVRDTAASTLDQRFGEGIQVVTEGKTPAASVTIRDCLVDNNRTAGVVVANAAATIDRSVVSGTRVEEMRGFWGDGISADVYSGRSARLDLSDSLVQGSARVGAVFFGARGSVNRSVLRSGKFSIVLEQNAIPEIGADNVYEQNQLNEVSVGQNLEPAPIPPVPNR